MSLLLILRSKIFDAIRIYGENTLNPHLRFLLNVAFLAFQLKY